MRVRSMWCRVFSAAMLVASSLCAARPAQAVRTPNCVSGPCRQPETVDFAMRGADSLVLTNFGLLLPRDTGYELACEETFGGAVPERLRTDGQGRVFMASRTGLFMSTDGCTWDRPTAGLGTAEVLDVAVDPRRPERVWVLAGQPRVLHLSDDGGRTFSPRHTFEQGQYLFRLAVAPSHGDVLYVAGYGAKTPFILAMSQDGGLTFRIDDPAPPATRPGQVVAFLGVSPDSPQTVYLGLQHPEGDQVWKSTDGGRNPVRILTLQEAEAIGDVTFGANAEVLYVGGRALVFSESRPTARLYVSRDGGETWETPIPSGPRGPFLRCLSYQKGTLYTCGAGTAGDDQYLVGASGDEGKTWQPVATLGDLMGVKACALDPCLSTANWLCESHGVCEGLPSPIADAGTDAAVPTVADSGCGCRVGRAKMNGAWGWFVALGALWSLRRRTGGQRS